MKNKRGFTLAEVLITICILGVVAAITLPALRGDVDKNTWATGLKTNMAILNTAFNRMMVQEDVDDVRDTNLWTNLVNDTSAQPTDDDYKKAMEEYFKIDKVKTNFPAKAYKMSGGEYSNTSKRFYLGNSATININFKRNLSYTECADTQSFCHPAAEIVLDVNGDKKPNIMGKDMFLLFLGENGTIYPAGSDAVYNYSSNYPQWDTESGCQTDNIHKVDGTSCAGRVVDEG